MRRKKHNSAAYLLLLFIHLTIVIYTFFKKKEKKRLFIHLLTITGFAYFFEYIVINFLQAYYYKPRILKKPYFDHLLGAILSQGVFVPFSSLFITAFKIGWKGKILFSLYFTIVEWLFVKIDIYKHNWWRTIYTPFLLILYFFIGDKWFKAYSKGNRFVLFSSFFVSITVTGVNFLYVLASWQKVKFGFGNNPSWKEHFRIAPLYSITLSFISALLIRKNKKWSVPLLLVLILGIDVIINRIGLVKTSVKGAIINLCVHFVMIYLSLQYKKMVYDLPDSKRHNAHTV